MWETHINGILTSKKLKFKTTTHDKTIYTTVFKGHHILLLRQVDDFALACDSENIAKDIYRIIGEELQLPTETKPPFKYLGLINDFNGLEVKQYKDRIVLSSEKYINRVLKTHGWEIPKAHESTSDKPIAPISPEQIQEMYETKGAIEHSLENQELAKNHGFEYRTLLGELLYAYVTCRPDIGYSTTTLSKFAAAPADIHFNMLKGIARYLRRTIKWGIIYQNMNHI